MVNSVLESGMTVWHNGFGLEMKLISDGNGNLTGTYESQVGRADGPYPLCGQYNPDEECPSMGWVVQWKHPNVPKCGGWTCTSWSGLLTRKGDKMIIHATWILTQQTKPEKAWCSHVIGCGEFELIRTDPVL